MSINGEAEGFELVEIIKADLHVVQLLISNSYSKGLLYINNKRIEESK